MMRIGGFRVLEIYTGTHAIPTIAREKPDVIILDIMMPDISGREVPRYMRREPELADIPVIAASAKSMRLDVETGLGAGVSLYLTKPVNFRDLQDAVDRLTQES